MTNKETTKSISKQSVLQHDFDFITSNSKLVSWDAHRPVYGDGCKLMEP
jgi:hypothetical protein